MSLPFLRPGDVRCATAPDGTDVVVFCTRLGTLAAVDRVCPHLDWDLAEARVAGEELVCPAHGWSFTPEGRAHKRNEHGRADDKGSIATWTVREVDGGIEIGDRRA